MMATTPSERRRQIERLLLETNPHALDYLRLLAQEGGSTIGQVATLTGRSPAAVSTALSKLDKEFRKLTGSGGGLYDRRGRSYEITLAGKMIAKNLTIAHSRTVEAFEGALSAQVEAWLTTASDGLPDFEHLSHELPDTIVLRPRLNRSTDIKLHQQRDSNPYVVAAATYGLYTVCLEFEPEKIPEVGQLLPGLPGPHDRGTEVIIREVASFKVLADKRIWGSQHTVSISDILSRKCTLVVPEGGAVLDFLGIHEAGWEQRVRPVRATDLEGCLGILAHGRLPNPAMIVHGLKADPPPEGFSLYAIAGAPSAFAVRGFYHRQLVDPTWSFEDRRVWLDIWGKALDLWHTVPSSSVNHEGDSAHGTS